MPANTLTHCQIVLGTLSHDARRALWAMKTRTPARDISTATLKSLFERDILYTDFDFLSQREVVLLSRLGKRCLEVLENPDPPAPVMPPRKGPSGAKQRRKAKAA